MKKNTSTQKKKKAATKSAKPTLPNTTNTFLTYRNENFTVQYPAGYLIDEIENTTTQLRIYAALDGKLAQVFEIINYENAGYTQTIATGGPSRITRFHPHP